ncbi:hypothetical protein [Paenibacillus sp. UNC451MF]|uniref:hypothetical protein n=1 Tax=Paenibacillus sp. UNC451MF TaxID=1449063 RepID=UPI00048CE188|nr:hypothetical protein [Paenibacillus sp. UNC451MF]
MKRMGSIIVPSMLAIAMLAGCSANDKQLTVKNPPETAATPQPAATAKPTENNKEDVLKQMQLASSQAKEPRELIAFMDTNIPKVDAATADKMFILLEQYDERQLPAINANLKQLMGQPGAAEKMYALSYPFDFNQIKGDDNLKQWLLNQAAGKLALDNSHEGDFAWKIDYAALQKAYSPRLSEDMKHYLGVKATEDQKPFANDGGLKITRKELGDRLLNIEQYLTKYPSGQKRAEMKVQYSNYMAEYIHGYRYEAIDEKTMKLMPEVKLSYEQLVKLHPDTKTAQIVKAYLDEINKNKDGIYKPGEKGVSIIGDPLPNIGSFWEGLNGRIDSLFK